MIRLKNIKHIENLSQEDFDKARYVHLNNLRVGDLVCRVLSPDLDLQGVVTDIKGSSVYYDMDKKNPSHHSPARIATYDHLEEIDNMIGVDHLFDKIYKQKNEIFIVFKRLNFYNYLYILLEKYIIDVALPKIKKIKTRLVNFGKKKLDQSSEKFKNFIYGLESW